MAMRYNIENEENAVRQIQHYLLNVTPDKTNDGITRNGIYDTATENAVRAFQKKEGLNIDGIVDLPTWDLLWQRHLEAERSNEIPVFPEVGVFDMQIGDSGYHIVMLQTLLGEFSLIYPNTPRPAITGQFGLTTADAVRAMQRNYGFYADGIVTIPLWNLMLKDHRSKKQLSQYNHIF